MLAAEDAVLERFADSPEPQLRLGVARALRGRAWCLLDVGRIDEAIATTNELLARFESETDPPAVAALAGLILKSTRSLLNHSRAADPRQDKTVWWFATTAQMLGAAGGEPRPIALRPNGVSAATSPALGNDGAARPAPGRLRRMIALEHQRSKKALKLSTALVTRLADSANHNVQQLAAEAQIEQTNALIALGRWFIAVGTFTALLSQGSPAVAALERRSEAAHNTQDPGARIAAAGSLMATAMSVEQQGDPTQTVAAYDAFINRYHDEKSIRVKALLWFARGFRKKAASAA